MSDKEKKKKECPHCLDSDQMIDEDFCPVCGQPSANYKRFIEKEMEANGELDIDF